MRMTTIALLVVVFMWALGGFIAMTFAAPTPADAPAPAPQPREASGSGAEPVPVCFYVIE